MPGRDSSCWACSLGPFFSAVVGVATRPRRRRRLLLWLLLLVVTVAPVALAPPRGMLLSSSSSTLPRVTLTASYRLSAALCDSQETTTDPLSPPSTVGVPCQPTDVAAGQTEYVGIVAACLLLFGLFFLIGFKLWT
jgi:hypothetical protein